MRQSQLFTKTRKENPSDEVAKNAQLLIRAGYIYKVMAGVYAYTLLGLRVLENIKRIVREEMNAIGGQELIMSSLQKKSTWEITGRWDDEAVDVWFKSKLKDDTEVGFGWSHEEAIIEMMKQYLSSYKDLPINVYQFQTKLRNELRAKSGIMRGREFIMKDMYSCSIDEAQHEAFYQTAIDAYTRIFNRLGIGKDTYITFASGGAFTKFSHEFQTICDTGEDVIYLNREKKIALNEEVLTDENLASLGVTKEELEKVTTAEVGNIFNFGTHKSEQTDFSFMNEQGEKQFVHLGSYGIGVTRIMGVLVEKFADEKGIIWPEAVAPFQVHLLMLGETATEAAQEVYNKLIARNIEVLFDDRTGITAGEKFADSDLIGIPHRVVVSEKSLAKGGVEYKKRESDDATILSVDGLIELLTAVS